MLKKVWRDEPCIVAAPGPSLCKEQAELCAGFNVIAVNDAHRLFPNADTLYAADTDWWRYYRGVPEFKGEKLTCHHDGDPRKRKRTCKEYGIVPINARKGSGFSLDPDFIHYGTNSGFQAVNVAVLRGCSPIILVGFDMRGTHFFGKHPSRLRSTDSRGHDRFVNYFHQARRMHPDLYIVNCTPNSRLQSFPMVDLKEMIDACRKFKS